MNVNYFIKLIAITKSDILNWEFLIQTWKWTDWKSTHLSDLPR
jgi:hypothetical protein